MEKRHATIVFGLTTIVSLKFNEGMIRYHILVRKWISPYDMLPYKLYFSFLQWTTYVSFLVCDLFSRKTMKNKLNMAAIFFHTANLLYYCTCVKLDIMHLRNKLFHPKNLKIMTVHMTSRSF